MTDISADVREMLLKLRKESTGFLNAKKLGLVVDVLPGWKMVKRGREFDITSPDGKEFLLTKKDGYRVIVFYDFFRWALNETTWTQDILNVLNMPSVEDEKRRKKVTERTRENTGTCPCCFSEFKLNGVGKMVLHGYERPGYGYVEGRCHGVDFEPFEKSPKGTVSYVARLEDHLSMIAKRLAAGMNGEFETLYVEMSNKRIEITPDHKLWKTTLTTEINRLQSIVNQIESDIKYLNENIENWKEEELPWDRLQKEMRK